ncbi:MAG TPA: alpha/beta fold hydrolase [Mycobacterium sp.]|nr:alpha/beta fold hydrolase [Mycobacterium sp.]
MSQPTKTVVFTEATIDADGFEVRYLDGGQGNPLLVLHGGSGLQHNRTHDLLAATNRVIAIEIPGFDRSSIKKRSSSLLDLAQTVLAIADALELDRFSLMGTSFGAALAGWVATQAPGRVDKLVLISPAAIRPEGVQLPSAASPEELKALYFAHPDRHELPDVTPESAERNAWLLKLLGPGRDPELEKRLSTFPAPTLVLFGELDRLTPVELGRLYVELLPDAYLAIVYDAGHSLEVERPEASAEIIADFLDRGPVFAVTKESSLLFP